MKRFMTTPLNRWPTKGVAALKRSLMPSKKFALKKTFVKESNQKRAPV